MRQWVLSLPKRLRPYLHHNPEVAGAVLRVFPRAIRTTLRSASPDAPHDAQLGAVSFLHRFGSALNPHFPFHLVVLDGVFAQVTDWAARFHEATLLGERHWLDLQRVVQRRARREIGIRLALGAEAASGASRFVARGMIPVAAGLLAGIGASLATSRVLAGLLFGVPPADPITLLAVPALLAGVALVALTLPAVRAGRVDPVRTLRERP